MSEAELIAAAEAEWRAKVRAALAHAIFAKTSMRVGWEDAYRIADLILDGRLPHVEAVKL